MKNKEVILIMGVSGCGKTTIAQLVAQQLGVPYYDADDFHPPSNVALMQAGIPLTDKTRKPWLVTLAEAIGDWSEGKGAVLSCSALKEKYRKILSSKSKGISWVYLEGSYDLIRSRIEKREGHYMQSSLLQSQFDALEVPDYGLKINISASPEDIVAAILKEIK